MSRSGIDQLLYLMDEAFRDQPFHSLLNNLKNVRDEDWEWVPPDGVRTILHIVQHVGYAKRIYENHAFGDRSLTWDNPTGIPEDSTPSVMTQWLKDSQQKLRDSVAALEDDGELTKNRMAPWGMEANTRWIVNSKIQHDLYHAGEINHIRALRQRNDE
jgi:uncharacterized damage-inducible protein DinB